LEAAPSVSEDDGLVVDAIDAAVAAVTTGNFAALVGAHSGLTSVQLQPPTDGESPAPQPTQEGDDDATN
jgi:hypothetical protein